MDKYTDILYRLARFLAGVYPELLGAVVLLALQHVGFLVALFAIVVIVLKFAVAAIVFVAKFILSNILGSIAVWYLARVFVIHAWPRLPHGLRRFILKLEDRVLFDRVRQDQVATRNNDESAFSRNTHRHPHW